MANLFLTADTHFSHAGMCQFLNADGSKVRPWDDVEEMDEALVERWNETVRPKDKVYHLGDVAIQRKGLRLLDRLNGDLVLIKGNHDIFKLSDYIKYFRDIRAYHILDRICLSHIPQHPDSIDRFRGNIHGHLHTGQVMLDGKIDTRYKCVCVEQTNYAPVAWEEVKAFFN
jgi:calcineurin-like phosphoesterase family protein